MPVRSVKLKFVIPRSASQKEIPQVIWSTHRAVNEAVRYYESYLLLMRGAGYRIEGDREINQSEVKKDCIKAVLDAVARNGASQPPENMEEILSLLRKLYECIVPTVIGEKGNAQAANAFIGPLADPESVGFLSVFEKIGKVPAWVEDFRNGKACALKNAKKWVARNEGQARLRATGAPPKWVKLYKAGDPGWPAAFVADLDRKTEESKGAPTLVRQLKSMGVLPLFQPFLSPKISNNSGTIGPWDRLCFRLAVGHLLSWESWCIRSNQERFERLERYSNFKDKYIGHDKQNIIAALEIYQKQRQEALNQAGLPMDRPFRITRRMVRGWENLREVWVNSKKLDYDCLVEGIAKVQTKNWGRFGDPNLFRWLAQPENHFIWKQNDFDAVSIIARLNALKSLVERSKPSALMTLPDPIFHPRSIEWEAESGTNLKKYVMRISDNHNLTVVLPFLKRLTNDRFEEKRITLPLAKSDQFKIIRLWKNSKTPMVDFQSVLNEKYRAKLGAADLLMDWSYLSHRNLDVIENGDIGSVYLKLSLDIEPLLPDGWTVKRPPAVNHFQSALGGKSKYKNDVKSGFRVLAVDLGIRSLGACSVFELSKNIPEGAWGYEVPELDMWAVHERSFLLKLPGEEVGRVGEKWQKLQDQELRNLRRGLNRCRKLYRLSMEQDKTKRSEILEGLNSEVMWPFEIDTLKLLKKSLGEPKDLWQQKVANAVNDYRLGLGQEISRWRTSSRKRGGRKHMGKSMWAIQHLTNTRRFLFGWSHLGRQSGDIRRADRLKRGVFGERLLKHIEGVKEDRLKTGADLIVQAARGYLRNKDGQWAQAYSPCHFILFEDLSRYRMKTDRPPRENSQLMRWAHRSMPAEVAMQGELYGIHTGDTTAAFSSRYHARLNTPGIRCHVVSQRDLENQFMMDLIQRENPELDINKIKAGQTIPLPGGEIFACVSDGKLVRVNADVNASQNLQRRFWTRHRDAFRIPCQKAQIGGKEAWIPRSLGKRLLGGIGGYGMLVPTGHETGSCHWVPLTAAKYKRLVRGYSEPGKEDELESAAGFEFDEIEGETLELSSEYKVFFRDPSGKLLPQDFWYPSKTFWGIVKTKTSSHLRNRLKS